MDKNFLALSKQTATENKNKPSYFLLNIFLFFSLYYNLDRVFRNSEEYYRIDKRLNLNFPLLGSMSIEQPTTDLIVNPRYLIFVDKNFLALSKQTATCSERAKIYTGIHQVSLWSEVTGNWIEKRERRREKVSGQKWKFTERSEIHGRMKNEERTRWNTVEVHRESRMRRSVTREKEGREREREVGRRRGIN